MLMQASWHRLACGITSVCAHLHLSLWEVLRAVMKTLHRPELPRATGAQKVSGPHQQWGTPGTEEGSEADDDNEEPLLSALHEEAGSVGSTDTTDCDSELDEQIEEMAQAVDAVGDAEQRTVDALDDVRWGRALTSL